MSLITEKTISDALLAHYAQDGTTLTNLLKITAPDGAVLGLTKLDIDLPYDDGAGEVVYSSTVGMDSYPMQVSSGMDVDNSEALILFADSGYFSARSLEAGVLDYGSYIVYRVNFLDTSLGHEVLDVGTVGVIKNIDGLSGRLELRSLQQALKQNYGRLYSRTCRARFGSGGGGTCVQFGDCGIDAEALWQNFAVLSFEAGDQVFTADSAPAIMGPGGTSLPYSPGLCMWLTGENAGWTSEIEALNGAEITLRYPTRYPIADGDTFKARPDCDKRWETCRDDYANQLRFRGEPKIPLGDEGSQSVPSFGGAFSASDTLLPEPP